MDASTLTSGLGLGIFGTVVVILALSVIVVVHEYGHYIVGRWSGIHADVFSLGFGKPLWQRTDKRGTVWQVAALPLGGYVKFAGDANAASAPDSHAVEGMSAEDARHTMPGAPLWARTATVAAGPLFNFIFTALVFAALILATGRLGESFTVAGIKPTPFTVELQAGDEILAIAGEEVPTTEGLGTFIEALPRAALLDYTVRRDGAEITVSAPHPFPVIVGGISPKSAARAARLEVGDVITHADGVPLNAFFELQDIVQQAGATPVALTVWRDGTSFETSLSARARDVPREEGGYETRWLIGVTGSYLFSPGTEAVGLGEALLFGVEGVWAVITQSLSGLYHMIVGNISTCNMSGAAGMAGAVTTMASQGIERYIEIIAVISTAIGLINLFPIPVLDGGHLVFYAYEAVRGKPLPDRAVGIMMTFGLGIIAAMMLLGLASDFFCP